MKKFGYVWDRVKENMYRRAVGKKDYLYMYRAKKTMGVAKPFDTYRMLNEKGEPFRTLREAEAHRKAFMEKMMARTAEDEGIPDLHLLDEIFEDYIEHRGTSLAPNTIAKRRGDMKNHVIPYFKKRRIESITVGEVRNHIAQLRGSLAYRTVKSVLATMSLVWQYAMEMKIINRSIYLEIFVDRGSKVTVPKKIQGEQQKMKSHTIYSKEQIEKFFACAKEKGVLYYILEILCYYGGMRMSEALGLCWKDIDWNTGTISVNKQLIYDKNRKTDRTHFGPTKNKETRLFKAPPALIAELKMWQEEQSNITIKGEMLGWGISSKDLVVADEKGYLSHSKANHFREEMQKKLASDFGYHGFRRTVVSNLAGAGVPLKSVSDYIGHADTRTTEAFYLSADELSTEKLLSALQDL